jgi:hypothetical protein
MEYREHGWHEEQRGTGGDQKTADHGASERRILLAAFPQGKGKRPSAACR